jgi:hypothetical protein
MTFCRGWFESVNQSGQPATAFRFPYCALSEAVTFCDRMLASFKVAICDLEDFYGPTSLRSIEPQAQHYNYFFLCIPQRGTRFAR